MLPNTPDAAGASDVADATGKGPPGGAAHRTPLDFDRLDAIARREREAFAGADPFPHLVIDAFLPPAEASAAHDEFLATRAGWDHYHHYNEKKEAVTSLGPLGPRIRGLVEALHAPRFVRFVEALSGVGPLLCDPDLDGAGLHRVGRGGFLNVHSDFLAHTLHRTWSRQINLLLYFNRGWLPEWGGDLEFWSRDLSRCVRRIEPVFNRCVIFLTRETSFHGHPRPLACPEGELRKSLALYYFRDEGKRLDLSPTHYHALPGDSRVRRALVAADRGALRAYAFLKRYTRLSDGVVSRILKRF